MNGFLFFFLVRRPAFGHHRCSFLSGGGFCGLPEWSLNHPEKLWWGLKRRKVLKKREEPPKMGWGVLLLFLKREKANDSDTNFYLMDLRLMGDSCVVMHLAHWLSLLFHRSIFKSKRRGYLNIREFGSIERTAQQDHDNSGCITVTLVIQLWMFGSAATFRAIGQLKERRDWWEDIKQTNVFYVCS